MRVLSHLRMGGLWRNRDFLKLWTGQTVSLFGALMGALVFTAVLVLDATPFQMGLLVASRTAPGMLFGLAAGVWVDRLRRRPILVGADLGRAAMMGSVPAAYLLGVLRIEQLYLVAFVNGGLSVLFDVAYRSYLPSLVEREQLIEANSKLSASESVVEATAFSSAGWIVQLFSAIVATVIDAISYLFSALSLALIRAPERRPVSPDNRRGVLKETMEGMVLVWRDPVLRAIGGCTLARGATHGFIAPLIMLFAIRELGIQPGILWMIFATGGLSSLVGALVAVRVTERFGIGRVMVWGILIGSVSPLFIALAHGPLVVAAAFLVAEQVIGGMPITVYSITQISLRQAITPERALGRVNASMGFLELSAVVAVSLAAGAAAETIGIRWTLAGGTFSLMLGGLWLAASPVRRIMQPPPAPVPAAVVT